MDTFVISILMLVPTVSAMAVGRFADGCRLIKVPGTENEFTIPLSDSLSVPKACPHKRIFSQSECGCVWPPQPPTTPAPPTPEGGVVGPVTTPSNIPPPHCSFLPNPNDPFSYVQMTNDGERVRPCSNGTIFELNPSCNCVHWDLIAPLCLPDVSIGVKNGMVQGFGNGYIVPVIPENMEVAGDALVFNGNSDILMNLFDDVGYSNGLTVMLEFMESDNLSQREVLITNCDKNRQLHSFEIAVTANHVEFTIDVGKASYFQTNVDYQRGPTYKKVVAIYDGDTLKAYVDKNKGGIPQSGNIQRRARPMLLGNTECPGSAGFKGKMKGVSIYRCVKDVR